MVAQRIPRDKWLDDFEKRLDNMRKEGDREYRKTYDEVFDRKALLNIFRLFKRRILSTVEHPISTGKEANVFRATDEKGGSLALKIFRESTSTFKRFLRYIEGDPRFEKAGKGRKIIALWAQKEYANLNRLNNAGVSVPVPVAFQQNMVVMEYIGDDRSPALRLKDCLGSNMDFDRLFDDIMENIDLMIREAGIVHADLSEYNILMRPVDESIPYYRLSGREYRTLDHENTDENADGDSDEKTNENSDENANSGDHGTPVEVQPVIIDLGQATLLEHPMSREFFERDMKNIVRFFVKNHLLEKDINEKEFCAQKYDSYSNLFEK